ncbi:MAG: hypothetical protein MR286_03100 [Clostridiales bacterium]|nr:hypothetical protein [Clostridiales bacterium]
MSVVIYDKRKNFSKEGSASADKYRTTVAIICIEFTKQTCFISYFVKISGKNEQQEQKNKSVLVQIMDIW